MTTAPQGTDCLSGLCWTDAWEPACLPAFLVIFLASPLAHSSKLSIVAVAETGCASFCVALVSCLVAFALPTQAERRYLDTFPAQDASTRKATLTTGIANKLPSATKPTLQYIPYLSISRVLNLQYHHNHSRPSLLSHLATFGDSRTISQRDSRSENNLVGTIKGNLVHYGTMFPSFFQDLTSRRFNPGIVAAS